MITHFFSNLINSMLAKDNETAQKLMPYQNKVLQVKLQPLHLHFYIKIFDQKIHLSRLLDARPDAVITGTPLNLMSVLGGRDEHLKSVQITGDILWVHDVKNILKNLNIDWEEQLSHLTGDFFAYNTFQAFGKLKECSSRMTKHFASHMKEYIEEECYVVVSREESHDFCKDVDILRDDIERLEAKIIYLQGCINT